MNETDTAKRLIEVLGHEGFVVEIGAQQLSFRGTVIVRGKHIPIRLFYEDLEFSASPRIYVEDYREIPREVPAHLDEKNELCAVDRGRFVSDRYLVAEQALGLLVRVKEVLERNWTNAAEREIADEFPQHFGESTIKLALDASNNDSRVVTDANGLLKIEAKASAGSRAERCGMVSTGARLSFASHQKRPKSLAELLEWARYWDAALPDKILVALADLLPNDPMCMIMAPNGTVAFQLLLTERSPKLASVLGEHQSWRRFVSTRQADHLAILRLTTKRTDMEYILGRGSDRAAPLKGKSIVLVGCGAIGGYLSHALARLGAGFSGGKLVLIDEDTLSEPNIGRHLLGKEAADGGKAEGCKKRIDCDLPGLDVSARSTRVELERFGVTSADLVIDATGEQSVGDLLNSWMIDRDVAGERVPTLLHTWLEGYGAAAISYMSTDREFGCFRCLQPAHDQAPRYRVLRSEAPQEPIGACGETAFTPYGPAAPMMAAALSAQHASDWASGEQRPLLRVSRLDWHNTNMIKPVNPPRSPYCPACARRLAPA
jgi:molybdopterin/thiamine biosynthesis adenylyltransferase